ncbi:MAG: hypothetical protein O2923_13760 [Verrucomicrobia bacterium]|nr:hypothetical protein [Verrucomicrobiota bacterium]MDA1087240.1 hypothetical protein [Verrucomicrobiota bacterium]
MENHLRRLLIRTPAWAILGLLSTPSHGALEEPNLIEEAKAIYEDHLDKYRTQAEEKLAVWPTQYVEALQEFREHAKTLGDRERQ